jgi:hypothetical protein
VELPLFEELKRRRVFRALIAWGIVAFAVLQVIEPVMHGRAAAWPISRLRLSSTSFATIRASGSCCAA